MSLLNINDGNINALSTAHYDTKDLAFVTDALIGANSKEFSNYVDVHYHHLPSLLRTMWGLASSLMDAAKYQCFTPFFGGGTRKIIK